VIFVACIQFLRSDKLDVLRIITRYARFANGFDEKLSLNKVAINLYISVLFVEFVIKSRGEAYICKFPLFT